MKKVLFLSLILLLGAGCQKFGDVIIPIELLQGSPTGGVMNIEQVSIDDDQITLKLQVFAVNHFGNFIEELKPEDFRVTGLGTVNAFSDFSCQSLSQDNPASVGMLFDHSGSISGTDPNDARIQAGVEFTDLIRNKDEACVHYFNDNMVELVGFTSDRQDIEDAILEISTGESGGTQMYTSLIDLVPLVASGSNFQRAIIVFTDGVAGDTGLFDTALQSALNSNVVIVAVALDESGGLSPEIQALLTELATTTGGAFIEADNVTEVISAYQSMGQFLLGSSFVYEFNITFEHPNGDDWTTNDLVQFEIFVDLIDDNRINLPVYHTVD